MHNAHLKEMPLKTPYSALKVIDDSSSKTDLYSVKAVKLPICMEDKNHAFQNMHSGTNVT